MDSISMTPPLVVIVGPTASGKTSVAINIAKRCDGEIICADSRTIYKGMDIGTAKPTQEERQGIPHWGLDLVEPGERFTAADFKRYADEKIHDIRLRGKVPIIVGGTGLYVDSVLFNFQFGGEVDALRREELNRLSLDQIHDYCIENNIKLPENSKNKRYVIRAIEKIDQPESRDTSKISTSIIVGIATDRDELRARIADRTEQIFDDNVVHEATILGKKYGWQNEAMTGNIYPLIKRYLDGTLTLAEAKEKFTTLDWRLAKRQLTWLRRNEHIVWLPRTEVEDYVLKQLANEH